MPGCVAPLGKFLTTELLAEDVVLCVGHGATVKSMAMVLEAGLAEDEKIQGERTVSCFAEFRPVDPSNPSGPWRSVKAEWQTGDFDHHAAEAPEDQGLSGKFH